MVSLNDTARNTGPMAKRPKPKDRQALLDYSDYIMVIRI